MPLELQNIEEDKNKLNRCDIAIFHSAGNSFRTFTKRIKINSFRHISNLEITFDHPVTVISGTNKVGKTSLLLLLACSHEEFRRLDSTSPTPFFRNHVWNDVISFTAHENESNDYSYELDWRIGTSNLSGTGKRLASSRSWSGLGKRSSDPNRVNAKIRNREVRLIDLERILPARNFSEALLRKANLADQVRLNPDIERAFAYIFDIPSVEISEIGSHINKSCFLIKKSTQSYSSFGAASGEEAVIYLLKDLITSPRNSLILIDEVEAGFHPSIQRKIADLIQHISWRDKKQFIITTHSPTLLSSFPSKSRKFIERVNNTYKVASGISHQAASSKMDSVGHPLVRLYCEDDLAAFLIRKILVQLNTSDSHFTKLFNIVKSGAADQVKNDYIRHKRNFSQYQNKIGYSAIFDGDHKNHPDYNHLHNNTNELTLFLRPFVAPEKFLIQAYLDMHPNEELAASLQHGDHHDLFQTMVNMGLAADAPDAINKCYQTFEASENYIEHKNELTVFLKFIVTHFTQLTDET